MMRLTNVELQRFFLRRLTSVALLGGLVITGLILFGGYQQAKPLSEQQMSYQRAQFDEAHKSWEQDLNGSKGYVVLGLPFTYGYDDLANLGKNVTSQFISGAPSQAEKPPVVVAALTNVWVVGIGGAVLAGGIIAWLKWN